jgi:hypothetical protein
MESIRTLPAYGWTAKRWGVGMVVGAPSGYAEHYANDGRGHAGAWVRRNPDLIANQQTRQCGNQCELAYLARMARP